MSRGQDVTRGIGFQRHLSRYCSFTSAQRLFGGDGSWVAVGGASMVGSCSSVGTGFIVGPLKDFTNSPIRFIARGTATYASRLGESFHPDLLQDALVRDRFFSGLWAMTVHQPLLERLLPSELYDIHQGDVPVFTTYHEATDLWSSTGHRIENAFPRSGMDLVVEHVNSLSAKDMQQQISFIRGSLTTLSIDEAASWPFYPSKKEISPSEVSVDELIDEAKRIGNHLIETAIFNEERTRIWWIAPDISGHRKWELKPLQADTYSGLSGIGYFLGYLGKVTGEKHYNEVAGIIEDTVIESIFSSEEFLNSQKGGTALKEIVGGAFGVLGGIIHLLTHLGAIYNQQRWLEKAETLVDWVVTHNKDDETFDIIGGSAGNIAVILNLYRVHPIKKLLQTAIYFGDHLIENAERLANGFAWDSGHGALLLGFSHGTAGIAWALYQLYAETGEQRFRDAGDRALDCERAHFSEEQQNWPDLRPPEAIGAEVPETDEPTFMTAWCHGAPGIGISRLSIQEFSDDPKLVEEIDIAVNTTIQQGFNVNHSLCHGALGNLDLLLKTALSRGDQQLMTLTYRIAHDIVTSIHDYGWLCGIPLGAETPGLMTGLSGIGFELMRLAYPQQVPSILALEPARK